MKVFIDTNIYLNYFRGSDERLSSLQELKRLLRQRKLGLVLPGQTRDEYLRNRNVIAEQSRNLLLRETELKLSLPAPFLKDWREATHIRKQVAATKRAYQSLLKKYDAQVSAKTTPADILIRHLFGTAEIFDEDEAVLRRAYFRYLRGHPPRKNDGSFGDAISWESLLANTADDLVVISKDSDFSEKRAGAISFNGFLEGEWASRCAGKTVKLYVSLGEFINTFEKREAVKEKVIEQEKSPDNVLSVGAVLGYPAGSSMVNIGSTVSPYLSSLGTLNTSYLIPGTTVFAGTTNNAASYLPGTGVVHSAAYTIPQATVSFVHAGSTGDAYTSGSLTGGENGPWLFLNKRVKFCPYCGKDVEAALSAAPSVGIDKFACPHCNSDFDPGGVA